MHRAFLVRLKLQILTEVHRHDDDALDAPLSVAGERWYGHRVPRRHRVMSRDDSSAAL